MKNLVLNRIVKTSTHTLGVMLVEHIPLCFTIEPPWKMNQVGISCIPEGTYFFKHYLSEKYKRMCVQLHSVYGRSYIAIHNGNVASETKGCILPGMFMGSLGGATAVRASKDALELIIRETHNVGTILIRETL